MPGGEADGDEAAERDAEEEVGRGRDSEGHVGNDFVEVGAGVAEDGEAKTGQEAGELAGVAGGIGGEVEGAEEGGGAEKHDGVARAGAAAEEGDPVLDEPGFEGGQARPPPCS